MRHTRRSRWHPRGAGAGGILLVSLLLASCTVGATDRWGDSRPDAPPPFRAFSADSWWNMPLPADVPTHPNESAILEYMQTARQSQGGCLRLAGASNDWGQPVYWVGPEDPSYDVDVAISSPPPEVTSLRIPVGAASAPTSDAAMTVFDVDKGYVAALTGARFDPRLDTWTATGASVTYLDSDGLHSGTEQTLETRNAGSHRGNNGATMMARYDEVAAGAIDHVLKVASGPETSRHFVFPMIGSDGESRAAEAPAQGLRFRIRPDVDLDSVDLAPAARVIADALQSYGFYIGDSGGVTALKLENTRAQGRGELWTLPATALCSLPLSSQYWDVLPEGYFPGAED